MKDHYWTWIYYACFAGLFITGTGIYLGRLWTKDEPGIKHPDPLDFLDSIGYALLYTVIRYLFEEAFRDVVFGKVKANDPINFELKKVKCLKEAFCSVWYSSMTILGLSFFANTDSLPTSCFGSENCEDMARNFFIRETHWTVRMYFMIQFAYHCHTLVYYEIANRRKRLPEYNEMMLHHILAVGLIVLCYTSGFFNYGITFLMIADGTDFFLNLAKVCRDLKLFQPYDAKIVDCVFLMMIASWAWFRAYVLPWCVLRSCYIALFKVLQGEEKQFFHHPAISKFISTLVVAYAMKVLLLSILGVLNFYWVFIMLKMAYGRVFLQRKSYPNTTHGDELQTHEKNQSSEKPKQG